MTILRLNEAGQPPPPIGVGYGALGLSTNTPYSLIAGNADPKIVTMLGAGSAGQVLAGVAGNNPIFKDVDTVSGLQLINSQVIGSGTANISTPQLTGFDEYIILLSEVATSAGGVVYLRFSVNGSTYLGGTNYGISTYDTTGPLNNLTLQAQINLCPGGNMQGNVGDNNTFIVRLTNIDKAVTANGCFFMSKYRGTSPAFCVFEGDGSLTGQTAAITNARFLLNTGTFTAANLSVWGLLT